MILIIEILILFLFFWLFGGFNLALGLIALIVIVPTIVGYIMGKKQYEQHPNDIDITLTHTITYDDDDKVS